MAANQAFQLLFDRLRGSRRALGGDAIYLSGYLRFGCDSLHFGPPFPEARGLHRLAAKSAEVNGAARKSYMIACFLGPAIYTVQS